MAALAGLLAVAGTFAWWAHGARESSIDTQVTNNSVIETAWQLALQEPGHPTAAHLGELVGGQLGVAPVDHAGVVHFEDAAWEGVRITPRVRLTPEEVVRLRRPGAVVEGRDVDGNRVTPWVVVTPMSGTSQAWLLVAPPLDLPPLLTFDSAALWILAAVAVPLTLARSAHGSTAPRWWWTPGDLRRRISVLVVGTTAITCALLSMLTLEQAQNRNVGASERQLEQAGEDAQTALEQQLRAHPMARTQAQLPALPSLLSGNWAAVAVAPIRAGAVDFTNFRQISGGALRDFAEMPTSCLDLSGEGGLRAEAEQGSQWGGEGMCGRRRIWWATARADSPSNATVWVVMATLTGQDNDLDDLRTALVVGSLLATGIAMSAASRLARSVQRPVVAVRRTAERIADGDLDARVAGRTNDELGRLGAAVNTMADRLTAQISQLEQANEHQRRFVSDVAHELRTPAAALLASATALENPATRDEAALRVAPQVRRLAGLTEDLLEISRLDAGQAAPSPVDFDLSDLVREVANGAAQAAGLPGDVRLLAPGELPVCLDPVRVQVAVRNLVDNALRHGRPPVTVLVRRMPSDGASGAPGRVVVEVGDEGAGVPPELRDRIFDRFVQADPSRHGHGSGLGLAIARANARLLGGDLVLDADNRTFRLTLPAA